MDDKRINLTNRQKCLAKRCESRVKKAYYPFCSDECLEKWTSENALAINKSIDHYFNKIRTNSIINQQKGGIDG